MIAIWINIAAVMITAMLLVLSEHARRQWRPMAFLGAVAGLHTWLLGVGIWVLASGSNVLGLENSTWIARGDRVPRLDSKVRRLQTALRSASQLDRSASALSVCVLGDSTHFFELSPPQAMQAQIVDQFPEALADRVRWSDFALAGLDVYEYYLIVSSMAENPPDIVLVPVNLRSFGESWRMTASIDYPELERYFPLRALAGLQWGAEVEYDVQWDHVILRKLDYWMFDARGHRFFRGMKLAFDDSLNTLDTRIADRVGVRALPINFDDAKALEAMPLKDRIASMYDWDIAPDHEYFTIFHALNRLAHRQGTTVVYYATESNVISPEPGAQERMFLRIRDELLKDPGVHFLWTLGILGPGDYEDWEHLKVHGVRKVAGHLAEELARIAEPMLAAVPPAEPAPAP